MTCIDSYIQSSVSSHVKNYRIPVLDFDMVYYADDTLLMSRRIRGLNERLQLTEQISLQHGLKLNKDKCFAVQMNNNGRINFYDGSLLVSAYEDTHLGNEINKEVNIRHLIVNKMSEVRRTWYKLTPNWKATRSSKKWKLFVVDAIIRSKLL